MKLEAFLATLCFQLAQVGFHSDPAVTRGASELVCECHCSCPVWTPEIQTWQLWGAGVAGAGTTFLAGLCGFRRGPRSAPTSPRRKGHGVLEHPGWGYFGALVSGR